MSKKQQILELYSQGKSYNEISEIVSCSKGTISFHCQRAGFSRSKLSGEEVKAKEVTRIKNLKKTVKLKAVLYKGGKCERCGYSKCMRSLDFHHLDPKEKEFGICKNYLKPWIKLEKELDKCILVCRNCHGEIHEKEQNLPYDYRMSKM